MSQSAASNPPAVSMVEVGEPEAGQRLDNFLIARLKGVPRSRVYRIVRAGEVRVNGGRSKPDRRLEAGDRVRIPPVRVAERDEPAAPGRGLIAQLEARILHEDDALLVIDKPSGLAVHGGSGVSSGLIEALRAMRPDCPGLELVHRLDRDTSGCILIAKKRSMLRHLHEALREGTIEKTYLALVRGRWPRRKTRVVAALEKNILKSGERVVTASEDGKAAETRFAVVRVFAEATLVEARPLTGRTHQIRVHAQHAGHPLAGDPKYGDREFDRRMAELGLKRLFLHARSLRLVLPDGKPLEVSAPLDAPLEQVLARMSA